MEQQDNQNQKNRIRKDSLRRAIRLKEWSGHDPDHSEVNQPRQHATPRLVQQHNKLQQVTAIRRR
jgi:hypothetical protein